jgi:hypothetical protein
MKPAHERVARREGTDMSTRTKQQTAGNNQYGLDNPGESILFYRRKINRLPKEFSTRRSDLLGEKLREGT